MISTGDDPDATPSEETASSNYQGQRQQPQAPQPQRQQAAAPPQQARSASQPAQTQQRATASVSPGLRFWRYLQTMPGMVIVKETGEVAPSGVCFGALKKSGISMQGYKEWTKEQADEAEAAIEAHYVREQQRQAAEAMPPDDIDTTNLFEPS
jgi:hypothetical protein